MRRLIVLATLGFLLVSALWWMFLISPRNGDIADLEDELVAAQDTESRLRIQIAQLEEIKDREVEYTAAVGKLDSLIPDRPLLDDFIEQVYTLTEDTGVRLQSLSPSIPTPTTDGAELREIDVAVQIEGEFFELLGFLFGLSDMERLVRVDAVSLSSSIAADGSTILSAGLEVRLFTLADLLPVDLALPGTGPGEEGDTPATTTVDDFEAIPESGEESGG
jgi:Tfp pilus assembly protein PilO